MEIDEDRHGKRPAIIVSQLPVGDVAWDYRGNGEVVSETVGIDTRQGPFDNWNASYTGYLLKKVMDLETIGSDENNQNIYIYLRYAEVLLNYAEASLELGDEAIAAEYINKIRNRAGMPDFTGDMTEALRYERKIELAFEDVRWFDIRRWKILLDVLDMTPNGIDITQITEDGDTTTTWKQIGASVANNPCEKLYWFPISTEELNRAPGLIQNPGYELYLKILPFTANQLRLHCVQDVCPSWLFRFGLCH